MLAMISKACLIKEVQMVVKVLLGPQQGDFGGLLS